MIMMMNMIIIIIIINTKEKTCTLIDVAIPADRNVAQKEEVKKLKCMSLCTDVQRMRKLKYRIIPAITGAARIVTRGLRGKKFWKPYQENIPYIQYGRQLCLEHHTHCGKHYSVKLET